jgi:hypothetical protein
MFTTFDTTMHNKIHFVDTSDYNMEISTTIDINIMNILLGMWLKKQENVFQLMSQTCKLKLGEG